MHVLITCKFKKDWINNNREKVEPLILEAQGQLTLQSVLRTCPHANSFKLSCMSSLPASMKRIRSKSAGNKRRHRFPHYKPMGVLLYAQGQLTSLLRRIWNSSDLSCMSLLPASMKRIGWKTAEKSGDTVSPIITLRELSVAMETRVLIRSGPKPYAPFLPPQGCF